MMTVKSMQVLFKESAFLQSIVSHKCQIKMEVKNFKTLMSPLKNVNERLVVWDSSAYPSLQLTQKQQYDISFTFIKNDLEVGHAGCLLKRFQNKKDCLDIVSRDFKIIGKIVFQMQWKNNGASINYSPNRNSRPGVKLSNSIPSTYAKMDMGKQQSQKISFSKYPSLEAKQSENIYAKYQQRVAHQEIKSYIPPNFNSYNFHDSSNFGNKIVDGTSKSSSVYLDRKKETKKQSKKSSFLDFFGGCFGTMKTKKKKPFFIIQPILVDEKDLEFAPTLEEQPFSIQYYSKQYI